MIEHADSPQALTGWDTLAAGRTFYTSARWLAFSDSDGVATGQYLLARSENGRPRAAVSAHWSPRENNEDYLASAVLPDAGDAPALVLGGRRGYLSAPLLVEGADDDFAGLVTDAVAHRPEAAGRWWWPYLATADARRVRRATGAAGLRLVGADCTLAVPAGGTDEYLDGLATKQRRTNVRRELRRYAESGLSTVRVGLSTHADVLGPLLSNVQRKYGHDHSAEQMTALLRRQAAWLDTDAVVFLCLAPDDPRPVGFCLAYRHGRELAVRVVGFDYARLRDAAEYPNLAVHEPLRYCHEQGLTRLHLGMESYEAKCRRGARIGPLWAVSSFTGADARRSAARAAELAGRLPRHEADGFLAAVAAGEQTVD